jgi:hypothetical protein
MRASKRGLVAGLATVAGGLILGSKRAASAQPQSDVVAELADGEGIFVDGKTFKIAKGKPKGDPIAQIARLGAKEVGPGAIVFRFRDKLYMVEAPRPIANMQSMKSVQDDWDVSYMNSVKDFQDNWNTSYMK